MHSPYDRPDRSRFVLATGTMARNSRVRTGHSPMSTSGTSEGSKMKKRAYYAVGLALTALTMTGCATASAGSVEPTATSTADSLTTAEIERAAIPSMEFASAVVPVLESFPDDFAFFYFDSDVQPIIGFTKNAGCGILSGFIVSL